MNDRIPVTTIGGYLGAGKTTLIRRLLRQADGLRFAVLVNDFGSINIDAELIASQSATTIALTNGCACCVLGDDLRDAFDTVARTVPRFDRVIVEASGVADPRRLSEWAHLPGLIASEVVVVADVETIRTRSEDPYVGVTIRRQLAGADRILFSKVDRVTKEMLHEVTSWVAASFPSCEWEEAQTFTIDGCNGRAVEPPRRDPYLSDNGKPHVSITIPLAGPLLAYDLCAYFSAGVPGLVRAKGFVDIANEPSRHLLQVVGSDASLDIAGVEQGPHSQAALVCIGIADVFDAQACVEQLRMLTHASWNAIRFAE